MGFGPQPTVGQNAEVQLDGLFIQCLPGKYKVYEADRFGQKISEGDLRYQDFNPYESAEAISNLLQGAGIKRMSDVEHTINLAQPYKESSGVNCSGVPIILAPQQILETLPGSNGPPVWAGEFVPSTGASAGTRFLVCVAGTKVFYRNASGSGAWVDTGIVLGAVPLKGAVGVFNGTLIFGYGAAAVATATSDLINLINVQQTTGPTNIYVFAHASDRAASYIAGGTNSVTHVNQVLSSASAASGYAGAVVCGTNDSKITALAPGGGIAIVFVGREDELGEIGSDGIYRRLMPYDSRLPTNSTPLRWWLGTGGDNQRGPVILVFPRERSLWEYQPSTMDSGNAQNISPWANPVRRPPNSKGIITSIQGSARWLYYTVTSSTGHSWVWRRDSWVGPTGENAPHTYLDLGTVVSQCLTISNVTSATSNPMLYIGTGNNITSVILPQDGEDELSDSNCRFTSSGYVDVSDLDMGFPDEDKVWYTVRVVAQALAPGGQTLDVQFAGDGGILQDIGSATSGPEQSLSFPAASTFKRVSPRIYFSTTDSGKTPQLWAITFRCSINPFLYRLVTFQGTVSVGGSFFTQSDDLSNPLLSIKQLWADRAAGLPVPFVDRWNDSYLARIISMADTQVVRHPDSSPETVVDVTLLITAGPGITGVLQYDTAPALYDVPTSIYG